VKVRRGDIHWIEFPGSSTREQAGRRPAIIAQADSVPLLPTVFVVPLTSNPQATRFPGTFEINPSPANGLHARSIVLAFQLRAIDRMRVGDRLGSLDSSDIQRLDGQLRLLLSL